MINDEQSAIGPEAGASLIPSPRFGTSDPAVAADTISVTYPSGSGHQVRALDGVTVNIGAARWTALVGASGSGKSTLLHVIGGLQRPSSGRIAVLGTRLDGLGRARLANFRLEHVGFVFQAFHLLPHLQAWENVALPLVAAGVAPDQRHARAMALLSEVGLGDRARHRPGQLSGGEQQRVAIARAMARPPKILIADEPTGNLDAESAAMVLDVLARFARAGTTLICATHDMDIAAQADQVLRLNHGVLGPETVRG